MIPFKTWLENKLLTENYQPEVTGILKVNPESSFLLDLQSKVLEKFPDLKPLPQDKLHITMLHQKLAKPSKTKYATTTNRVVFQPREHLCRGKRR